MTSQSPDSTEILSVETEITTQKSQQPPQEDQQQQQVVQIQKQPQIFFQIIDIINEYQKGNFLPALHCLRYNLIPKNYLDYQGYNFLHVAVSQNQIPLVIMFLDHFKIDANIRSSGLLTPLMIACNYGLIEVVKILCERGAQINPVDNTGFSALLYAVKMNRIPEVCYLLHQEADINVKDVNGCSVAHWSAYRNNLFLLKMFRSLGININELDKNGLTPLERAIQSTSQDCVEFLLEQGDGKLPANLKFDEMHESDLKTMIRKRFFPTKNELRKEKYKNMFLKKSRWATFFVYLLMWSGLLITFFQIVKYSKVSYTAKLSYLLMSLYFIGFAFWYFTKSYKQTASKTKVSPGKNNQANESDLEMMSLKPSQRLNSSALDKLIKGQDSGSIIQEEEDTGDFPSFLHEIAYYFDTKNYRELTRWNPKDYCASCLIKRPERSAHPERSLKCVPHFHHYSHTLGKSISKENHYLYLLLLIQQQIMLGMWIICVWMAEINDVENSKIWFIETAYRIMNIYSIWKALFYVLTLILTSYNTFFLAMELYGVVKNVTYNEIMNRNKCNYLFAMKQDSKGKYVKYVNNPYDVGFKGNIKDYVMRVWNLHKFDQ